MKPNWKRCQFPWRDGNSFSLLVDGECFVPAMLKAVDDAMYYVAVEMYLVKSGEMLDRFIEAFIKAAKRDVQIYLLFDDYGSREFLQSDRRSLNHSNIHLRFYNPFRYGQLRRSLFRDHRKLLLVDNKIAFTGGAGLSDEFYGPGNPLQWRETMVQIQGPCVHDWQNLFEKTWHKRFHDQARFVPINGIDSYAGNQSGRVTVSDRRSVQEIKRSLVFQMRAADNRVWIATAYFLPPRNILRMLKKTARRGLDVRLILPGEISDHPAIRQAGRRFYKELLSAGVRIYEYQPRFNHSKLYLCDNWASIGSSNLDRWNFLWNLEGNQEVEEEKFSLEVTKLLEMDMLHSVEILPEQWKKRSQCARFKEWFWGKVESWVQRISLQWSSRRKR